MNAIILIPNSDSIQRLYGRDLPERRRLGSHWPLMTADIIYNFAEHYIPIQHIIFMKRNSKNLCHKCYEHFCETFASHSEDIN